MNFDVIMEFAAKTKQYMVYGVNLAYPFFSLVTFLGVIKMAFNIPPELAAIAAIIGVYGMGVASFRSGLYSKDMNITWRNTPMAVELHASSLDTNKRIKELEEINSDLQKSLSNIEKSLVK